MADSTRYWRKSILFEIVNRRNPLQPVAAFTLTIPPESISIDEPQRVTATKTFGGLFVDDYGADNIRISISGNTGGVDLRETYSPANDISVDAKYDGKSAFYHFRDTIMRYKTNKKFANQYADYDLVIYDLSTVSDEMFKKSYTEAPGTPSLEALSEGYVVLLQSFKLNRSKDRPLFFNYSIELLGIRPLGEYRDTPRSPVEKGQQALTLIQTMQRGLTAMRAYFIAVKSIVDKIDNTQRALEDLATRTTYFFQQSSAITQQLISSTVFGTASTALHLAQQLLTFPASFAKSVLGGIRSLILDTQVLGPTWCATVGKVYTEYLGVLEVQSSVLAAAASFQVIAKTPTANGNIVVASSYLPSRSVALQLATEQVQQVELTSQLLDADVLTSSTLVVYGFRTIQVTASTTLEALAAQYFGDPSSAEILASYNGIRGNEELVIGSMLRIPILLQGGAPTNNYIYDAVGQDIYGSDVRLSSVGDIVLAESNDFALASGANNLVQALNLRLMQTLGTRLRLTLYGLRDQIGGPAGVSTPIAYILANIKDTVLQDPRVSSIENIILRGQGDALMVSFDVKSLQPSGVIPYRGVVQ